MALRDLGVARLRDIARPERVWQLDGADLEPSFPPLRALDAPPHNLPVALSSLIGRHAELREIASVLASHRLVTLSEAGGIGKTRLAQQVAGDLLERHDGGSWWVELASLTSGPQVTERVAAAVGLGSYVPDDVTAALARQLGPAGPTLVVLDNAEHLVDAVATLAQALLETCPNLRLLVTSREPLGLPGETVWRVPSLATAPTDSSGHEDLLQSDARGIRQSRRPMEREPPRRVITSRDLIHLAVRTLLRSCGKAPQIDGRENAGTSWAWSWARRLQCALVEWPSLRYGEFGPRPQAVGRCVVGDIPSTLEVALVSGDSSLAWKKSTMSDVNNCVEWAVAPDSAFVLVRDSQNPEGGCLQFTAQESNAFVSGVKAGQADLAAD